MPPLDIPDTVFFADEISLPGGRRFLFDYYAFELCCALKPFAIAHVAEQHGAAKLLYLDSDILVLSSFGDDLEAGSGSIRCYLCRIWYSPPAMHHWNFSARWHNTALITAVSSRLTAMPNPNDSCIAGAICSHACAHLIPLTILTSINGGWIS